MTDLAHWYIIIGIYWVRFDKWSDRPHLGPKRSSILQELFKIRSSRQDSGEADIGSDERSGFNSKRGGHERTPLIIVPLQQDLSFTRNHRLALLIVFWNRLINLMQSLEREGQESNAGHLALCGTDPKLCSILQYPNVSDPFNVVLIICPDWSAVFPGSSLTISGTRSHGSTFSATKVVEFSLTAMIIRIPGDISLESGFKNLPLPDSILYLHSFITF